MARSRSSSRSKSTSKSIDGVDTPPQPLPIPNRHREILLPVYHVGSIKFEELCCDVLRHAHPQIVRANLKRKSGLPQFGVDVEGFNASHQPEVVVSCKCHEHVNARDLVPWTNEFVRHIDGHWKDKGVKVFALAVTHPGNADDIADAARTCQSLLDLHGIRFELWDTRHVTGLLRKEVALVDRYFNAAWVEAISPTDLFAPNALNAGRSASGANSADLIKLSREIADLSRDRDGLLAQRIDDASADLRAGRSAPLIACLEDIQSDAVRWRALEAPLQAKALRARAMMALNRDDVTSAGDLLSEADHLSPPPDRTSRAWYVRATEGIAAAVAYLQRPSTTRELEILANLHLERREPDQALRLLEGAAHPPSSEQLRLRALSLCMTGDRSGAVRLATEACSGPTPSLAAVHTCAILHVMAALAEGAEVQLGAVPNPFSSALVRITPDAVAHLDHAITLLDRQIPIVDAPLANDLELWKLAILLLHPTKTREARDFADNILARPTIDPMTVAWCHSCGLKIRVGRIRKMFEDAIRAGGATPSHVVVLAMLEADRSGNSAAAALIAKHRPGFHGDDDAFLLGWQHRFEGRPPEDIFGAALHQAERKTYEPLIAHLRDGECSANQVLIGAGLLAVRSEWSALDGLRNKLLAIGTPRAVDLAARAALESGKSADAIEIVDGAGSVFPDGRITASLRHLRARANDALGRKGAAIADLNMVAADDADPGLQRQIIHSLISIGLLPEARDRARVYIEQGRAKTRELVQFADVFKHLDPQFSRTLIEKAAADPKLTPKAAPALMVLASLLGHAGIEDRMMQVIADITRDGSAGGIIRFDDVQDVIAFVNKQGDTLQKEFDTWQSGMKPAHATFAGNAATFAALYLADPADRMNSLNRPMPMLVRAANARPQAISPAREGSKPKLIVDVSALLLAKRCNLIEVVDATFEVVIPEAVPLALIAMEDAWPLQPEDYAAAAQAWLSDTASAVRLVDALPEDAVVIGHDEPPFKLIPERVLGACDAVLKTGEMSRAEIDAALSRIGDHPAVSPETLSCLALQPWTLVRLANVGLLEPIARAVPTYMTHADREELAASLAKRDRSNTVRRHLTELREFVADRLVTGRWSTLPSLPTPEANRVSSHQLLSLVEIIEGKRDDTMALVWIEDRAMGRARIPGLVTISDIADYLLQHGALDARAYWDLDQRLREMGVVFMPIPAEQIANDVRAAQIVDGVLVETPELAKWRRWYARSVDHLGLANQAPEPDPEGRIAGEPRYILDMIGTARNVLAPIWADTSMSDEDKRARSDWVWTCLRFEMSPAIPWSNVNDQTRRNLMSTVLMHTADLPLMARLNTERLPKSAHQPFIDWFVQAVLDNRCTVDPDLGHAFARQLASLLAPRLTSETDLPDADDEAAQRYMAIVFRRYLELFPPKWREAVMSHFDLEAKLGVTWRMTLNVGGVDIPAETIQGAITEALPAITDDHPVDVSMSLDSGGTATLTLRRLRSQMLEAEVTVGEDKARLEPILVAVNLSDEGARLQALSSAASSLDMAPDDLPAVVASIAQPPALADRVRLQKEVFDRDLVRRLDRIRHRLRDEQSLEFSDLSLPEPEAVAQYIRLRQPFRQQPGTWLEEIADNLANELGAEAAARRLGGFPLKLSERFFARFADCTVDATKITSAAHARVYLQGLGDAAADDPRRAQLVAILLDRLEHQVDIMPALLRKGYRQMRRCLSWRQMHPDIASALLWVWADRMTAALTSANVDPKKLAEIINRTEPADLTTVFVEPDEPSVFRDFAIRSEPEGLAGALIAGALPHMAITKLPEDLRARVLSTIGFEAKDVWFPKLGIAFPHRTVPGAWVATDPIAAVKDCEAATVLKPFSVRDPDGYALALLDEPVNDENPFLITGLLAGVDFTVIAADVTDAVAQYVDTVLVTQTDKAGTSAYKHAQRVQASCLGALGREAIMTRMIADSATLYASRHRSQKTGYVLDPTRSPAQKDLAQALEMVLAYARHLAGSRVTKAKALAELTALIADRWPGGRQGVIEFLDRSTTMLDSAAAAAVWPSLLKARQS